VSLLFFTFLYFLFWIIFNIFSKYLPTHEFFKWCGLIATLAARTLISKPTWAKCFKSHRSGFNFHSIALAKLNWLYLRTPPTLSTPFPVPRKHICPAISITFLHFNQIAFRFGLWPLAIAHPRKPKKIVCAVRVLHFQWFVNRIYSSVLAGITFSLTPTLFSRNNFIWFLFYFSWQFLIALLVVVTLATIVQNRFRILVTVSDSCRPRRTLEIIEIVLPFCPAPPHSQIPNRVSVWMQLSVCLSLPWNFPHSEWFEEFVRILVIDFRMPRSLRCSMRIYSIWSGKWQGVCDFERLISC